MFRPIRKFSVPLLLILMIAYFMYAFSCGGNADQPAADDSMPGKITVITPPDFNEDFAYESIKKQITFGPRIPGTPAHQNCAKWLEAELRKVCDQVIVQSPFVPIYDQSRKPCINLIASFNPEQKKRILLFTHWDTRPWSDRDLKDTTATFEGADDGGSGTAILLELARIIAASPCKVGIDILLEDVEDYGPPAHLESNYPGEKNYCIGTQYWAEKPHVPGYHAYYGILLDMVGSKNATFLLEGASMQFAPSVMKSIWSTAQSLGYGNYFLNIQPKNGIVDDHVYVNQIIKIPSIDIIAMDLTSKTGFAKHWHTQQDNLDIIDKQTLKAVGQTLLQVIYNETVDSSQ